MTEFILLLMIGLQLKHFVADYLLQFRWMIAGKGNFRMVGGYAHATIHAVGTIVLLSLFGVPAQIIAALALAELAIHYLLDFAKVHYSSEISSTERPKVFWALNGLDQLFHHLTYVGIIYFVVMWMPS